MDPEKKLGPFDGGRIHSESQIQDLLNQQQASATIIVYFWSDLHEAFPDSRQAKGKLPRTSNNLSNIA